MRRKYDVTGMTCAACSARVEKVSKGIEGVKNAEVNLLAGTLVVESDSDVTARLASVIANAGYGLVTGDAKKESSDAKRNEPELTAMKKRIVFSAVFLVILMYFTMGHMIGLPVPAWYHGTENALVAALLQLFLTLPVMYLNRVYYSRGLKALWNRAPNMDSLIAVGSGAAVLSGVVALFRMAYAMGHGDWETVSNYRENLYFESGAMILTLITFGKFLEARAKGRAGDAIRQLMDLSPKTAVVRRGTEESEIPVEQVQVGDVVIVRSGGRIPVDGVMISGRGSIDQSALTGESVPVEKIAGDNVAAATINTEGYLELQAQKVGEDTTLAQIIHLVEEAGGSKAPIARLADKIAGIFVPVVMGIALLAFVVWMLASYGVEFALTTAIAVLVISCPCALGLATPVAIMVGTGRGARMGVLFKNAQSLETLHRVDTVVLDKTGTLTNGKPQVTDVLPGKSSPKELLNIAAALEARSEHPFAKAILEKNGASSLEPEAFETIPGKGVAANLHGMRYYGGNRRLMQEQKITIPEYPGYEEQGKTLLYFGCEDGTYLGAIAAADVLKNDSVAAVAELARLHLDVVMLTGDNRQTAQAIAHSAQISHVIPEVLPEDKAGVIKQLQQEGHRVLMVGDGINDAPALATADVGMAIGAGTDVAIESADVVLMSGSLQAIAHAVELSKATIRNIRQNLFWAFFYNCLGIPLAAGALYIPFGLQLNPMIGAAAMSLSSVFVVSNALRLRFFRPHGSSCQSEEKKPEIEIIKEETVMTTVIKVEGMMCTHCKAMVEKVCKAVPGATDAEVDLSAKQVTVTGDASVDALKKAIVDAGYEVIE